MLFKGNISIHKLFKAHIIKCNLNSTLLDINKLQPTLLDVSNY